MQRPELSPTFNPEPSVSDSIIDHIGVAYGLGIVAFIAHKAQIDNTMVSWPDFPREVINSMSHPFLGYTGGAIASVLYRTKSYAKRVCYGFGLGTLNNFGTEAAQSALLPHTPETNFLANRNIPETKKDFGFAIAAMIFFAFREKRLQKNRVQNN
ncbi:MAG: hypothetical protein Q7T41_02935 [Candidatus Saccharibacteria bacterium]|nr:hypothetical protein [Candidatus Saccharibacteria bacterium]